MLNPISDNYEGTIVDMSNPTSILIGNPNANGNDGLIRMYERHGENWIQKAIKKPGSLRKSLDCRKTLKVPDVLRKGIASTETTV